MTSEERKSAANGIWLCQNCAKLVDSSEDAWTVEGLCAWKRHAESQAAKHSRATHDEITNLIDQIDHAVSNMYEFMSYWRQQEDYWPMPDIRTTSEEDMIRLWHEHMEFSRLQNNARLTGFRTEIEPRVADILTRAEIILGSDNVHLEKTKRSTIKAALNDFSIRRLADSLSSLKAILQLH
jgi:hypothetical protein